MSRESNPQASTSLLVKIFPHPAHFLRRAGETMNKQNACTPAWEKERFGCRNDLGHALIISMSPRSPSSYERQPKPVTLPLHTAEINDVRRNSSRAYTFDKCTSTTGI